MSSPSELESTIADVVFSGREFGFSLNELAAVVHASPMRAGQTLRRLQRLGYPVRLSRAGIIERLSFTPIDSQQLNAGLSTEKIGRRIEWRLHVGSTQDELKKLRDEAPDGTVLVAETQYAGRGRLSRSWFSAIGGIWMSILLRPTWPRSHQILPLTLAGATAKAIDDATDLPCLLKWPNDLMIRSRKVAGFLAEAAYQGNELEHLILGLGVNANIETTRLPKVLRGLSTSLSHELGQEIDRTLLAKRIIQEMDRSYRSFESGHASELLEEVKRLCSTLGKKVQVTTAEGTFKGEAVDLGRDGQLIIRKPDGTVVPCYAGDVVHLR